MPPSDRRTLPSRGSSRRCVSTARRSAAFSWSAKPMPRPDCNGWRLMPPAPWRNISATAGATRCSSSTISPNMQRSIASCRLLLRRPPGREAYPGDVFYIHSRLLERAAKLSPEKGGGSLTALPIAETQAGNLSAYIPTNLISITDGQIYLEPKLFYEGHKPAVNVGLSVSRVGAKAQPPVLKDLARNLRLAYAQFLELEVFMRFGAIVDERTRQTIEHGRRIRAVLSQPENAPLTLAEQAALLLAVEENSARYLAALRRAATLQRGPRRLAREGHPGRNRSHQQDRQHGRQGPRAPSSPTSSRSWHRSPRLRRRKTAKMEQLARLKARLTTLTELGDIIVAMRALAAAALQEGRQALPAVSRYALLIESGISDVAAMLDATAEPAPEDENWRAGNGLHHRQRAWICRRPQCRAVDGGRHSPHAAGSSSSADACKGRRRNGVFAIARRSSHDDPCGRRPSARTKNRRDASAPRRAFAWLP